MASEESAAKASKVKKEFKTGFSYYWQINMRTIQGRLTSGFLTLAALAMLMMLITNILWKIATGQNSKLMQTIPPAHQSIGRIADGAAKATVQMQTFFVTDDVAFKNKSLSLWRDQIKPAADSLNSLATVWDDDKTMVQLEDFQRSLAIWLSTLQTSNIDKNTHTRQLASQMDLLTEQSHKLRQLLVIYQQKEFETINKQEENIPYSMFTIFTLSFVFSFMFGIFIVMSVLSRIRFLKYELRKLGSGNLPERIPAAKDEMNSLIGEINVLTDNLKQIKLFAQEVGQGNFESDIKVFDNEGDLGMALAEMRESLRKVAKADAIRNWSNEGYALFAEILRHHADDLDALCDELIRTIAQYLKVVQGSIFVASQENDATMLILNAVYAYDKKKFINKTIKAGEGLLGQVFLEGEVAYLTKVPQNYVSITSGLGEANPRSVVIVPLKFNGQVNGVIELASFKNFEPYEIDFLKKIGESISSAINSVKAAEHTRRLLQESQLLANQMRIQEETMRQQMEELQATQEEMERKYRE